MSTFPLQEPIPQHLPEALTQERPFLRHEHKFEPRRFFDCNGLRSEVHQEQEPEGKIMCQY